MRDTIHLIAHTKPAAFVLENVIGLADIGSGNVVSPLEMIMRELRQYGYQVKFYTFQLETWVDVSRDRTSWKKYRWGEQKGKRQDSKWKGTRGGKVSETGTPLAYLSPRQWRSI